MNDEEFLRRLNDYRDDGLRPNLALLRTCEDAGITFSLRLQFTATRLQEKANADLKTED